MRNKIRIEKGYMDWEDYTKIIDRMDVDEFKTRTVEKSLEEKKEIFRRMNFSG